MAVNHSTRPTGAPLSRLLTGAELQLKRRAKLYAGLDPAPDAAGVEVRDGH